MSQIEITIEDLKGISPFSQGSTEIFHTGLWSNRKPVYVDKTSPCRQSCPVGNDISRAFFYAANGDFDKALRAYREENPLPGICGRVCYHPCEGDCNRKSFDEALNIRGFERFLADHGRVDIRKDIPAVRRKEKIAVAGSGPAGLAAAYYLARLGYGVTIFEALEEPGGMLMYGIPEYRLPKAVLRQEIGYIRDLGVEIRTSVRVVRDVTLEKIRDDYQAVFIAVGGHAPLSIGIEGEDLPGVMIGVHLLRDIALGKTVKTGKRIAVIGGGNTAIDCARSIRRMGARDVTVYRRSTFELADLTEEVRAAEAEGIEIDVIATANRFIAEDGHLAAMELVKMAFEEPDASGAVFSTPVRGTEFIVPVDTAIVAVGQAPEQDLRNQLGLEWNRRGMIQVSPGTAATNVAGVFAGGDSAGNRAFVADAIASGKVAALSIFCYLEGRDFAKEYEHHRIGAGPSFSFQHLLTPDHYPADLKKIVPYEKVNTLCFSHASRNDNPDQTGLKEVVGTFQEVTGGLDPERMAAEIERCFKCGTCTQCDLCFLLCPDISIAKDENGYRVKTDYCKGCTICATSCPRNVIDIGGAK